jgi:hypothetical protein
MHDGLREVILQIDSICITSFSLRAQHFLISTHKVRIKLANILVTLIKVRDKKNQENISVVIWTGNEVIPGQNFIL